MIIPTGVGPVPTIGSREEIKSHLFHYNCLALSMHRPGSFDFRRYLVNYPTGCARTSPVFTLWIPF
jgi:hypothetical protein